MRIPHNALFALLQVSRVSVIIFISAFGLALFGCSPEGASDLPRSYWAWEASAVETVVDVLWHGADSGGVLRVLLYIQ